MSKEKPPIIDLNAFRNRNTEHANDHAECEEPAQCKLGLDLIETMRRHDLEPVDAMMALVNVTWLFVEFGYLTPGQVMTANVLILRAMERKMETDEGESA